MSKRKYEEFVAGEHITFDHPYYAWVAEQARLEEMRRPPPPDLNNPYDCWGSGSYWDGLMSDEEWAFNRLIEEDIALRDKAERTCVDEYFLCLQKDEGAIFEHVRLDFVDEENDLIEEDIAMCNERERTEDQEYYLSFLIDHGAVLEHITRSSNQALSDEMERMMYAWMKSPYAWWRWHCTAKAYEVALAVESDLTMTSDNYPLGEQHGGRQESVSWTLNYFVQLVPVKYRHLTCPLGEKGYVDWR